MDLKKEAGDRIKKYPVLSTIIAAGLVLGSLTTIAKALDVDFRFWVSKRELSIVVDKTETLETVAYNTHVCQIKYRLEDVRRRLSDNRVFAQQQSIKGIPRNHYVEDQFKRLRDDEKYYMNELKRYPAHIQNRRCP